MYIYMYVRYDRNFRNEVNLMESNKILGTDAAKYTVVIPKDAKQSEYRLAVNVAAILGIEAPVVTCEEKPELEILVGNTCRTKTAVGKFEFAVAVVGKKVEIVGGSCFALEYAYRYCRANLAQLLADAPAKSAELHREDISADLRAKADTSILGRAGEIRLLYHNVWGWANGPASLGWEPGNNACADQRSRILAEGYAELAPDVICLQEYTNFMMRTCEDNVISLMEKEGYAEVVVPPCSKVDTATPIIYNTKTVKLIDSGVHRFTFGGGMDKFITWGVFETLNRPRKFGVISGHLAYQGGDMGQTYRMAQVPLMIDRAEKIKDTYKCHVFFGGDMNCVGFSAPYRLFTTMGAIDTWSLCESTEDKGSCSDSYPAFDQKTRLVCREYNPVAGGTYMTGAIDHIFYIQRGEKPSFRKFDIIHENYLCTASDHCPVVLDMDF